MFSNLSQNNVLYVLDLNSTPKVLTGPIERISIPRPKYATLSPSFEMVVDIWATIGGERREFKGVPNSAVADFGDDSFILAESESALNSYINVMIQNSESILNSVEKHEKRVKACKEALQELNPSLKADAEKDKMIMGLKDEVSELKQLILGITRKEAENK